MQRRSVKTSIAIYQNVAYIGHELGPPTGWDGLLWVAKDLKIPDFAEQIFSNENRD